MRIFLVALIAGIAVVIPTTAMAQTPGGVDSTVVDVTVINDPDTVVGFGGCKTIKATVTYKSLLKKVLYKMWLQQGFCWNGARVTALYDFARGKCCVDPLWSWEGFEFLRRTGGVGESGASVLTEGHFKQSLFCCTFNRYPRVRIGMDNSGAVVVTGHN